MPSSTQSALSASLYHHQARRSAPPPPLSISTGWPSTITIEVAGSGCCESSGSGSLAATVAEDVCCTPCHLQAKAKRQDDEAKASKVDQRQPKHFDSRQPFSPAPYTVIRGH